MITYMLKDYFFTARLYNFNSESSLYPHFYFLIAKYLQKFKLEVVEYYLLGHANSVRSQILMFID
jgi:hypothetical protein